MNTSDDLLFDKIAKTTPEQTQQAWTRWNLQPIGSHRPAKQKDPAEQNTRHRDTSREMLARVRKQTYEAAHKQGYDDGHAEGFANGLKQGLADGQDQGRRQGYQAGLDDGLHDGREQAEQSASQLIALAAQCATALDQIEVDVGQELVVLAVRIAERILHTTLDIKPEIIQDLIDDVVRINSSQSATLELYVNPADLKLISEHLRDDPDTSRWRILPDETITRGGCKAHTALGDIDATLEKRWQRVIATLTGET